MPRRIDQYTRTHPGVVETFRQEVERALANLARSIAETDDDVQVLTTTVPGLTSTAPVNITGASPSAGAGTTAARHDHLHDIDMSACLDTIDSTRGTIPSRGASGWVGIDPGTAGYVLTSNGAGADPTYQAAGSGLTQEQVEDIVGALLVDTDTIDLAYSDGTPSVTASIRDVDSARWITVRDLDFAGWPDTDFAASADGTHALDDGSGSITWNKVNRTAANGAPGYFRKDAASDTGDDAGAGLRIMADASLATTLTTSTDSAAQLWVALSTLDSSYDESAEYVVQLQVTRLTETGTITGSQPTRLGLFLYAPTGTPAGTPVRVAGVAYRRVGAADWRPTIETSATTVTSRTDQAYPTSDVLSLHFGPRGILGFSGLYSSGWPTMASLTSLAFRASAQSTPNWADVFNHRDTRLVLACCSGVSNTGSIDTMVRRMRLLRRRT